MNGFKYVRDLYEKSNDTSGMQPTPSAFITHAGRILSGLCGSDLGRSVRLACVAGKYTVPVLWDKKSSTIVNNESAVREWAFRHSALGRNCIARAVAQGLRR